MNIIGIVTEYNPFHNGHKYQIDTIKRMYPDSLIIVVTSSSFTERGEISFLDKWTKAKISLDMGIDLVIELPFVFSTESSDIFASSSIKLLNELKIDTLVFGSETNDVEVFKTLANIQLNNKEYDKRVKDYLDKGLNFPTSMSKALKDISSINIIEPNDILALSYTKEILKHNKDINIVSIKRTSDYHDISSNNEIISASNIRNKLLNSIDIKKFVPNITYKYLKDIKIDFDLYFNLLKYKINTSKDLSIYWTVDEGIENRLKKYINSSDNLDEFINSVKTKRYTYNRINRMLTHILIGFTKVDKKKYNSPSYIRILGMSNKGRNYLNSIKKTVNLPIITKYKDMNELSFELKVTNIYSMLVNNKSLIELEYKNNVIIKDDK